MDFPRPLEGITVLSLEQAVAAPLCSRHLADMGARVIKVERPGSGDFARDYDGRVQGMSSHFVWANRSKESLTLDLKQVGGRDVLQRLLARSDVLLQNLAPGAARRLGLSFELLHPRFPGLIVCDISGYGEGGAYQDKKAYDLLIQSESGFLSVTGTADEPAKAGCSISDISAGMYAYSGILNALLLRNKTGQGSRVDVTMLESMIEWMGFPLYYSYDGASPPARTGASHATIYPYGPFPVGDGSTILLGVQNDREWAAFCSQVLLAPELIHDPRFGTNSLRSENREALRRLIVRALATIDIADARQRLDSARIANARVNDMREVWSHPQLAARQRWSSVDTPAGRIPALLPPAGNSHFTPNMKAVPALGQHTTIILTELGYSSSEREGLASLGAI